MGGAGVGSQSQPGGDFCEPMAGRKVGGVDDFLDHTEATITQQLLQPDQCTV